MPRYTPCTPEDMDVVVHPLAAAEEPVEIVERKGIGHPDTMCDAIAEEISRALCREYQARFGAILHHNVDKALLRGGRAEPAYGGGEVIEPIELYLAGRATQEVRGARIPVHEIALDAARGWLAGAMHALDVERHVVARSLLRPGSVDLVDLFAEASRTGTWLANDTSIGAGYAPRTDLERIVLAGDAELRAMARDPETAHVGEDTKIMAVRRGRRVALTVACAMIGRFVASAREYAEKRAIVAERVARAAERAAPGYAIVAQVNAADDLAAGRAYLTVTGTSAEAGDDGEVGRGNRTTGLITPYRPMTLEAAAGKNPASHVGKLYSITAQRIASEIVERVRGVSEARCWMVSTIGRPVTEPAIVDVAVRTRDGAVIADLERAITDVALAHTRRIADLSRAIVRGDFAMY